MLTTANIVNKTGYDSLDLKFTTGTTAGTPGIGGVTPAAGSLVITVTNLHSANAFNGTLKINFAVIG